MFTVSLTVSLTKASTALSMTGGGLGEAGAGASVNGSGASDLVSAAAWEEGAAAAAGAEKEGLPLEGGSYTAFCQAIRFVYRIFAKPPHLRAACIKIAGRARHTIQMWSEFRVWDPGD